ncbi:MAG TPA: lipopolysaccharide biosynthesis protein, partial [Desulfobulbaceae bacterium]|nr:lipopolysaccharide biosynthesis protein [Desulfobulbaceae bacterium]
MKEHRNIQADAENVPVVQGSDPQHLPSVDVREVIPVADDEIHLRDYLDVLVRRKWIVIIVLLVTFFSVALYTFTRTPLFLAKGVLKVSSQGANVTKFENVETNIVKMKEFQQTQVKLLQSEQLAGRVIAKLKLDENPLFNPFLAEEEAAGSIGSQIKGIVRAVKNFIRFQDDQKALQQLSEEAQQQIVYEKVLKSFQESFEVSPVRNSELIEISFESPESQLSARIVNTAMQEFLNMQMDSQMDIAKTAGKFLEKKIIAAQVKLEKSEKDLTEFSRRVGLVSLDPKLNLVMKQLEELNDALAKARTERINREATYQQAISENSMNLPQILNDPLIQELKTQYATLQAEYQDLSITFKPAYPKMQQLAAKMKDIADRIEAEKQRIIDSIKNEYETALKKEEYLTARTEEQKKRAIDLNDKATQYKILLREVDTNKSIYQSLLQRSKEIDATLGADALNIQIVDSARPPIVPSKPRIAR